MTINFLTIIVMLAMPAQALAAKVFKWIDDNGLTHYSGQKPSDNVELLPFRPTFKPSYASPSNKKETAASDTGSEQAEGDTDENAEDNTEKASAEKKDNKPKLSAKKRRELCQRARSNRSIIESKNQVRERDAQGNTRYLTESQRQARLSKMRKLEKDHCN